MLGSDRSARFSFACWRTGLVMNACGWFWWGLLGRLEATYVRYVPSALTNVPLEEDVTPWWLEVVKSSRGV